MAEGTGSVLRAQNFCAEAQEGRPWCLLARFCTKEASSWHSPWAQSNRPGREQGVALVPEACFPEAMFPGSGGQRRGRGAATLESFSGSALGILIELEGAVEILWFKLVILQMF